MFFFFLYKDYMHPKEQILPTTLKILRESWIRNNPVVSERISVERSMLCDWFHEKTNYDRTLAAIDRETGISFVAIADFSDMYKTVSQHQKMTCLAAVIYQQTLQNIEFGKFDKRPNNLLSFATRPVPSLENFPSLFGLIGFGVVLDERRIDVFCAFLMPNQSVSMDMQQHTQPINIIMKHIISESNMHLQMLLCELERYRSHVIHKFQKANRSPTGLPYNTLRIGRKALYFMKERKVIHFLKNLEFRRSNLVPCITAVWNTVLHCRNNMHSFFPKCETEVSAAKTNEELPSRNNEGCVNGNYFEKPLSNKENTTHPQLRSSTIAKATELESQNRLSVLISTEMGSASHISHDGKYDDTNVSEAAFARTNSIKKTLRLKTVNNLGSFDLTDPSLSIITPQDVRTNSAQPYLFTRTSPQSLSASTSELHVSNQSPKRISLPVNSNNHCPVEQVVDDHGVMIGISLPYLGVLPVSFSMNQLKDMALLLIAASLQGIVHGNISRKTTAIDVKTKQATILGWHRIGIDPSIIPNGLFKESFKYDCREYDINNVNDINVYLYGQQHCQYQSQCRIEQDWIALVRLYTSMSCEAPAVALGRACNCILNSLDTMAVMKVDAQCQQIREALLLDQQEVSRPRTTIVKHILARIKKTIRATLIHTRAVTSLSQKET